MRKIHWLTVGVIALSIAIGWFTFHNVSDDAYEGMSIIPEKHEDIPLYKGLKPKRVHYVTKGDHWVDIYDFYLKELPKHGWKVEFVKSALEDHDPNNDWSGFRSRWIKEGFDGVLWVSASYNQFEDESEVLFDKTPLLKATSWVDRVPDKICIYQDKTHKSCTQLKDPTEIKKTIRLMNFINTASDWEHTEHRAETTFIELGDFKIEVMHDEDKEVYLKSEKGTKMMKPEPEFFKTIASFQ